MRRTTLLGITITVFPMVAVTLLMLAKIFLLPGITLVGIGGTILTVGGVVFTCAVSMWAEHPALFLSAIAFRIILVWLLRSRSFNKVALKTDVSSKLTSSKDLGIEPGDEGITLSRLAPTGKVRIKGISVEARPQDELTDKNTPIVVIGVDSYNVIARSKEEINIHA